MDDELKRVYGNRVRVRVCGWMQKGDSVLLVRHRLGSSGELWIPPGGEVDLGEDLRTALVREIREESGLNAVPGEFMFVYEYIRLPFHAVEVFFRIETWSGEIITGKDPETSEQIIEESRFVSFAELAAMDEHKLHGIFSLAEHPSRVSFMKGVCRSPNP